MTHICVSKLPIIGSDNGLSPDRRQAIIWTNAGILLIGLLGTNFSEIFIEIHTFSFKEMHLKMPSGKWWPFCLCLNQGWGQFRNWNWNWYQFQFQFQELELKRNWIKGIGIGIGIDKEELKELIQFLFLIVNSFWFFAMFLAESLNQFNLKPFWIQLTRIPLDRYIILYDN